MNSLAIMVRFVWLVLLFLLAPVPMIVGQEAGAAQGQAPAAGEAIGPPHAAVKDAQHRPITAGGFVDNAPVVFADITRQAGLEKFHHVSGTPQKTTIIEAPGSGVAVLD
jgi:hypothetical protein